VNPALIHSNAPTAKGITRLIQIHVPSGNIDSIGNGISKSMKRFVKTDLKPSAPM